MDSFQFQASKLDKAYVQLRYKKMLIYKLVRIFRVVEICLISIFVWRKAAAAPQFFPVNVKFNKEYFHEVLMLLSSPRTVFLIGNAIILVLVAESGQRQNMLSNDVLKPNSDVYDEYVQIKDGGDRQVKDSQKAKSYKRSKSDTSGRRKQEKVELRRSVTASAESCKQQLMICGGGREEQECGEGMSDDEFKDMVEAFIARQQRNLRQESEKMFL